MLTFLYRTIFKLGKTCYKPYKEEQAKNANIYVIWLQILASSISYC